MQITVTIPDEFAALVVASGLTPEGYVEQLIAEQARVSTHSTAETSVKLADLEAFLTEMSAHSNKVPILPDNALTRESFYQDHD